MDSRQHIIANEAKLEKLKYAAKGERKPTFGMPIPEAILSSEIKQSQVYAAYITKYPHAQIAPKLGIGKGLMRKGVVPKPKNKKDAAPKRSKTITDDNNIFSDLNKAIEYAKQVNKEVDEGCKHLKIKFKAQEQQSPEAQLLLNMKQQGKASKIQAIQEEIMRKDKGEGSGAALESLDNNSSSNDSSESADDDKT
ncbi:hypothetical protein Tco_0856520, partial [Tanacetum coccineum]